MMDALRFERRGDGEYYKVVLHVGAMYVPVSDEDVTALKQLSAAPDDRFRDVFLDRMGYSAYIKAQLSAALPCLDERPEEIDALRQSIMAL